MNCSPRYDKPHEFSVELPAAHAVEQHARRMLREFAGSEGVPAGELETLEFVASELFSNAVDHGGGQRAMEEHEAPAGVRLTLRLRVSAQTWELRLDDQGGGDPQRVQALIDDQDLPGDEAERGRGFFLVKSLLERLEVSRSADGRGLAFIAARQFVNDEV